MLFYYIEINGISIYVLACVYVTPQALLEMPVPPAGERRGLLAWPAPEAPIYGQEGPERLSLSYSFLLPFQCCGNTHPPVVNKLGRRYLLQRNNKPAPGSGAAVMV